MADENRPMIVSGIQCPYCREQTVQRVTTTRRKGNTIIRHRKCQECSLSFVTQEVVIEHAKRC